MQGDASALRFPGFVQALSRIREPEAVVAVTLDGPLHEFTGNAGFLAEVNADTLRIVASRGLPAEFIDRYGSVPAARSSPMTQALQSLDVVTMPIAAVTNRYETLVIDESIWRNLEAEFGTNASLITIPLWRGEVIGGIFGCVTESIEPDDNEKATVLRGVGAALSLWLEARGTSIDARPLTERATSSEVPLVLTPRQREILVLVQQGKSNPVIAATLGFSVATVKAELARILRMLRCSDRHAAVATAHRYNLFDDDEQGRTG